MRKSSIHFAPVTNIKFAVSHSERTELSEPGYLLPKEHQLPNVVVKGSLSEADLNALFIKQKEGMTGQAKARGSSPFWEGVAVLKNTDGQEQSKHLKAWKVAYEKSTGHQVLHMSIHLDEGYIDKAGAVHYNPHAHVIVSRMNEKNRVIELKRKQLGEVQDLTAEILQMERGSTLEDRGGRRGRKHIPHREFRDIANQNRLGLEKEKDNVDFYGMLVDEQNAQAEISRQKLKDLKQELLEKDAEIERLKAEYLAERALLKASGEAKQADYQQLKKQHEAALADLAKAQQVATQVPELEKQATKAQQQAAQQAQELAQLKAQYQRDREALKASGEATQQDYQQLKKQHEAALAKLASTEAQAAQVPGLEQQLKAIQKEAINTKLTADERYKNLRSQALAIQAERDKLAAKVATLSVAPPAQPERRPASAAPAQTTAPAATAQQPVVRPALAPRPTPAPAPAVQAPAPAPVPTLAERLAESLQRLLDWIKGQGGVLKEINTEKDDCYGAVVRLDDLHAVQRVGRGTYAFHQLDKLDKVPALDYPKTEISYQGGRGTVVGPGYGHGLGR